MEISPATRPDKIKIIDQTLREGMQFKGLVFSLDQRIQILEFQEALGVDVCQAGYPSAFSGEAHVVRKVAEHARKKGFRIRTAALGRAIRFDTDILIQAGVDDLHFHFHVKPSVEPKELPPLFRDLKDLVSHVRTQRPSARISMAMLDLGRAEATLLNACVAFLSQDLEVDIISLPDTSGIMTPDQVFSAIQDLVPKASPSDLSVHCHNDMGMASANAFMGVLAGARVLEVSALGIGERNGMADLYTTAGQLKTRGQAMKLDIDNMDLFREYYRYVDAIVLEQTGESLFGYAFPGLGDGVKTHVAGTHAGQGFGRENEEKFHLNLLCGKGLVRQYLAREGLSRDLPPKILEQITREIKNLSFNKGRRLKKDEVAAIVRQGIREK